MASRPANGYVPSSALTLVDGRFYLENATAQAYLRAKAASGGILGIAAPGGAYRSYQDQYNMKHGIPSYAYWNLNPNSSVGLANPGGSSHGWGICIDIVGPGANNWMLNNGSKYGFSRPFGANDPNHWLYASPTWENAKPTGTQRQVAGVEVFRRVGPNTDQSPIEPSLKPGEIGNFNGWIHGEKRPDGNDIWFRGISGNWFWSGGFTDKGTHDLTDLNPVDPARRTVLSTAPARYRTAPKTSATISGEFAAGQNVTWAYFVKGEAVNGNDIWFVDSSKKQFSWSGGYTSTATTGLTQITVSVPEAPTWPTEKYSFAAAGDFVTRVAPADWSNFENAYSVPVATDRKGFPALPKGVVLHQWGAQGAYLISSVINTFQTRHEAAGDRVSAHFVVNADEIVQMVALETRAYHAGSGGNDYVGIEIDPYISETDAKGVLTERALKIIANVRKVLAFLKARNAGVPLTNLLHKKIPGAATACGGFIEPVLAKVDVSTPTTDPTDPTDPGQPDPEKVPGWFKRFLKGLADFFASFLGSEK